MRNLGEIFAVFLRLGLTSFGGPVAHLGYFRDLLVLRRKWLSEDSYADLVSLCQFLPGPASSQVAFALGVLRAGGVPGGIVAWCGFTLPSAALMLAFASASMTLDGEIAPAVLHGLQLVAVAIVAQAVWGMARTLAPDRNRQSIAGAAVVLAIFAGSALGQLAAIALGGLCGLWLCRDSAPNSPIGALRFPVSARQGAISLAAFFVLLAALPLAALLAPQPALALFDAFYQSGALVFGGGHVVLPLLQDRVVAAGWVDQAHFVAGYGVAQAVPGPLFTFAAYLGAAGNRPPNGLLGGAIALVAIFLPGLLLVYGAIPFWDTFRRQTWAQGAMRGANAAVVGILAAALYNPVWLTAILQPSDFALAVIGFVLLVAWRSPPLLVVAVLTLSSLALALWHPALQPAL